MTNDTDMLRDDLRALIMSPAIGLPDYEADPVIRRRVGRLLVDAARHSRIANNEALAFPVRLTQKLNERE